ncbi:MFS transporter [Streptomyces antimycoticus]|uniref:MFS transporter n=2 Tax=Streptomyces antimycoticus TaxID=68175 RepID=A0A4D4JVK5_9ACTN|nr:MFS transporter [Streptomyces antimycoticus]
MTDVADTERMRVAEAAPTQLGLATRRWRQSLFLLFFLPGLSISSWVTRTPDIRDQLGASTAQMGLVLFGLSAGSMMGILCSGTLVGRFGTRPVIGMGSLLVVASTAVIGGGALLASAPLVTAGLFAFGAGMGSAEVAINIDGVEVERRANSVVLPTLHGCFSLGTVVGALLGIAATARNFPVPWHLGLITLITALVLLQALRAIPAGIGRMSPGPGKAGPRTSARKMWKDPQLLLIGVIVLAMALAEGAANDWLPLLMVDGHGLDDALGSLVYAGFAAAMTVGRFGGGFFLERFGKAAVVRAGAISAALGIALVVFSDSAVVAGVAVFFWGLGASLGFPVALSAAGGSGPDQTARVGLVATIGYVAFLVGPPGLGFLGDHYGLRTAMLAVLACVTTAVFVAPAVGGRVAERSADTVEESESVPG